MIALIFMSSCSNPSLQTEANVDLERYMGVWYEIAALPTSFEKGCTCTKAEYQLADDKSYVKVINSCMKKGKQGAILGKAFVQEGSGNAKLEVQFFWPFKSDYYILDVADDYSYALVGHPDRKSLWILSRTIQMEAATYDRLKEEAGMLGFDTSKLVKAIHNCDN